MFKHVTFSHHASLLAKFRFAIHIIGGQDDFSTIDDESFHQFAGPFEVFFSVEASLAGIMTTKVKSKWAYTELVLLSKVPPPSLDYSVLLTLIASYTL